MDSLHKLKTGGQDECAGFVRRQSAGLVRSYVVLTGYWRCLQNTRVSEPGHISTLGE